MHDDGHERLTDSDPEPHDPGLMRSMLSIRRGETGALVLSAAYHFFVLFSYFLLRPVRESMGIQRGYEDLAWLMTGTMVVMFMVNPAFAGLVAWLPRARFIPLVYRIFALSMLAFFGLFHALGESASVGLGYAFYIWLSVFNLFVVSVFWAFMADVFNQDQGKRLFGFVALGGTLGALAGPAVTAALTGGIDWGFLQIAPMLNPPALLIVSCVFLEVAVQCVKQLMRIAGVSQTQRISSRPSRLRSGEEPGPGALEGLRLIASSPYLVLICIFMIVFTILSSLLYMEQGRIVEQTFTDNSARTAAFARLDFFTQALTLLLQIFITGRLVRAIGVGATLTVVPLLTVAGFAALMMRDSFAVLGLFMVLRRAFHYALDRPAREVLYTVVGPDAKYKSKSFIDTFVYRFGDAVGGWTQRLLVTVGVAVGAVAIPLAAIGALVGLGLGFLQARERWMDEATAASKPAARE